MLPRFFIDRPIFAWVIALVLMLAGALAVINLPIMQYPAIAPPQVGISASYPGASAQTVQDSVVQVLSRGKESELQVRWPGGKTTTSPLPSEAREIRVSAEGQVEKLK